MAGVPQFIRRDRDLGPGSSGPTAPAGSGLSLNVLCQQYANNRLRDLAERGARLRCLFLDPAGDATKAREREEGFPEGHLAALTELNIRTLALHLIVRV